MQRWAARGYPLQAAHSAPRRWGRRLFSLLPIEGQKRRRTSFSESRPGITKPRLAKAAMAPKGRQSASRIPAAGGGEGETNPSLLFPHLPQICPLSGRSAFSTPPAEQVKEKGAYLAVALSWNTRLRLLGERAFPPRPAGGYSTTGFSARYTGRCPA